MNTTIEKKVYNIKEVSALLNIPIQQVYKLVRENYIPHKRIGQRRILIPKAKFDQWLNENEVSLEKEF